MKTDVYTGETDERGAGTTRERREITWTLQGKEREGKGHE